MTDYTKIIDNLKQGCEIRMDCEELIRVKADKQELEKALFIAEMTRDYAKTIAAQMANEDDKMQYILKNQAENLEQNIRRTIIRLKTYLTDYEPEKHPGCQYCTGTQEGGINFPSIDRDMMVYIDGNKNLTISTAASFATIPIKFCPYCGTCVQKTSLSN